MYKMIVRNNLNRDSNIISFKSTGSSILSSKKCREMIYKKNGNNILPSREKHSKVYALSKHWFSKYIDYIKDLQKNLEKSFPKTMNIYRVFSIGTKDFYKDLKEYFIIKKKKSNLGIGKLKLEELQLLYKIPKDIKKLTPFLLTAALPFANYVVFPLGYYFPKLFLTSQYWDIEQRLDFALIDHKNRLKHNKPLLRCIQDNLKKIENQDLRNKWNNDVIATLGCGRHPNTKDIIECQILFQGPPYSLKSLGRKHLRELLAIHKMTRWLPYKRQRLLNRGLFIRIMDQAIENEGGVNKMPNDALRWALFFRGLNPVNMSTEDMKKWLNNWITISSIIDKNNISLLLHCPILLAYNHETNWTLLYY